VSVRTQREKKSKNRREKMKWRRSERENSNKKKIGGTEVNVRTQIEEDRIIVKK